MVSVEPSDSDNPLLTMAKGLMMQPILFIRALPYVTTQLSTYGLRFILRPVVLIAFGVHGLLLLLPAADLTASKPEELTEPEPEEAPVIEVQNLSDLIGDAPETELPPPPEEPQPPPAAAVPPEDIVITDIENIPDDVPLDDPPLDDPPPPFDRGAAQGQAADRTRTLGETTPPAPLLLEESQRPFFFDMNAGNKISAPLVAGLQDLIVFNDATLAEKEQEILNSFISGGDTPVQAGDYGGWPLYQLINAATNEEVGYLSIFQGTGGRTVLVGIWDSRP
ncbi:MAG: hypothetical protein AAGI45_10930 [Cyanobacteria bacterium P01_H01_bin.26]